MSPILRVTARCWLSRKGFLFTAAVHVGFIILAILSARFPISERTGAPPFNAYGLSWYFWLLPFYCGFRLRELLAAEGLSLTPRHALWHLAAGSIILAATMLSAVTTLVLAQKLPLLEASAAMGAMCVLVAWLGYTQVFLSFYAIPCLFAYVVVVCNPERSPLVAPGLLLSATVIAIAAWRHVLLRPYQPFVDLTRILIHQSWMDWLIPTRSLSEVPAQRLPSPWTALRLGMALIGLQWGGNVLGIVGGALVAVILLFLYSYIDDPSTGITILFVATIFPMLMLPFKRLQTTSPNIRMFNTGLVAGERLLPLSRQDAATASMMSFLAFGLSGALISGIGTAIGTLGFLCWHGPMPGIHILWYLLPATATAPACSAVAATACLTISRWAASAGVLTLSVVGLVGIGYLNRHPIVSIPLLLLAISALAPVLFAVPVCRRLAQMELP